jgi:hypothetical protein
MKKFIFLVIALLSLAVFTQAQSGTTVVMATNGTQAAYTPVAADTLNGTSAATKYWQFLINKPNLYYYVVTCQFNAKTTVARAAGTHLILTMSGSVDGTNFVTIDTTLFHPGTGNYSMGAVRVPASDVATGILWKYVRFTAVASDANKAATLVSLGIKIGNRY